MIQQARPLLSSDFNNRPQPQQAPYVVAYPGPTPRAHHAIDYGRVNGGPILAQASYSFETTTSTSPMSRIDTNYDYEEAEYEDCGKRPHFRGLPQQGRRFDGAALTASYTASDTAADEAAEDDEYEDGELPEHVRQCCDGKHDIGSLDHGH